MAWRLPRRLPSSGDVIDATELDDSVRPFVEELSRLNEQNVSTDLKTELEVEDLALDVAYRIQAATVDEAKNGSALISEMSKDYLTYKEARAQRVEITTAWQALEGLTKTWVAKQGYVMVVANIQYVWHLPTPSQSRLGDSLQAAIRLNGAVLYEFAAGDFDNAESGPYLELGHSGHFGTVDLEATVPCISGVNTVEVVVRSLLMDGAPADDVRPYYIYNRDVAILEMR